MRFTARGRAPRSLRTSANASSMPDKMRSERTTAMCVSGNNAVAVGVSAPARTTSVPVSAMAQNAPVTPRRSLPSVGRASILSPAAAQSRSENSGQQTPGVRFLRRKRRGQFERVEVAGDRRRNVATVRDPIDRAFHVDRALDESHRRDRRASQAAVRGHARPCSLPRPFALRPSRSCRAPCARAPSTASRAVRLSASEVGIVALPVPAHERVEALHAVVDGRLGCRV